MNALELSQQEVQNWEPKTQALAKLLDAHFDVFNAMEAAKGKRQRTRLRKALGTIYRAAVYLRVTA
jgi:hypothetical protein